MLKSGTYFSLHTVYHGSMNKDNEYCTFTLPHSIRQALADLKNTIDDVIKGREVHVNII
jgi:hypothetical protein